MKLTSEMLREKGACESGVKVFEALVGGTETEITDELVVRAAKAGLRVGWFFSQFNYPFSGCTELRVNQDPVPYSIEQYWVDGKLHRVDGPAVEWSHGTKEHWVEGKLHRDGGLPAIEWADGGKAYYVGGELHRDGGLPALIYANGHTEYWVEGKLHRDGGLPAVVRKDGSCSCYVNGRFLRTESAEVLK